MITLGLLIAGYLNTFTVPILVIALSASAIALGTASGGWRLIRILGGKLYKIRRVHGFAVQVTSTLVILCASLVGGPVSTTQVVSSAIMGVVSAERVSKVCRGVGGEIAIAWIVTIPATALVAGGAYWLILNAPAVLAWFSQLFRIS